MNFYLTCCVEWGLDLNGGCGFKSVSSEKFSIMITGSSHGYCSAYSGLRQSDPLSSFLFAIVGEAFTTAGEASLISGFTPAPNAPTATHLQFIDYTIIFCAAEENQVKNVLAIIWCFEVVSGLTINLKKSALIGVLANESQLESFAEVMGSKVGSLPSSYLGLPLSIGSISKSLWNPMVERIELKLASWEAKCLSFRGRVTIIKLALANLVVYFMSLFKCPMSIAN